MEPNLFSRRQKTLIFITLAPLAISVTACSRTQTPIERKVANEVAMEEPIPAGPAMEQAGKEILLNAEGLSAQQRERLRQLQVKSAKEGNAIAAELRKNRIVLLKTLVQPDAKDNEIDALKDRIVSLENRRTQLFLGSLDKAKRILGRTNSDDERIYRSFLDPAQIDPQP